MNQFSKWKHGFTEIKPFCGTITIFSFPIAYKYFISMKPNPFGSAHHFPCKAMLQFAVENGIIQENKAFAIILILPRWFFFWNHLGWWEFFIFFFWSMKERMRVGISKGKIVAFAPAEVWVPVCIKVSPSTGPIHPTLPISHARGAQLSV